jgi:hypothetical protein
MMSKLPIKLPSKQQEKYNRQNSVWQGLLVCQALCFIRDFGKIDDKIRTLPLK